MYMSIPLQTYTSFVKQEKRCEGYHPYLFFSHEWCLNSCIKLRLLMLLKVYVVFWYDYFTIQATHPRFQAENLDKNKNLYDRIESLAKKHEFTSAQLALAWILQQGHDIVLIPGEYITRILILASILSEYQYQKYDFFLLICQSA